MVNDTREGAKSPLVQTWKHFYRLQSEWMRWRGKGPDDFRNLLIARGEIIKSRSELYRGERLEDLRRICRDLEFALFHHQDL